MADARRPGRPREHRLRPARKAGHDLELPAGSGTCASAPPANRCPTASHAELHDGMAAFRGPGARSCWCATTRSTAGRRFAGNPYDPEGGGGTTNLVFDPEAGRLVATYPALAGTVRNCGGGARRGGRGSPARRPPSAPTRLPHAPRLLLRGAGRGRRSGQGSRCGPWAASSTRLRASIRARGSSTRPRTSAAAGFYRFLPDRGVLAAGGRLQMLAIDGWPKADLRRAAPRRVAAGDVGRHPRPRPSQRRPQPVGGQQAGAVAGRRHGRPARRAASGTTRRVERRLDRLPPTGARTASARSGSTTRTTAGLKLVFESVSAASCATPTT